MKEINIEDLYPYEPLRDLINALFKCGNYPGISPWCLFKLIDALYDCCEGIGRIEAIERAKLEGQHGKL